MYEFVLIFGITPVFLILGVIPGVIFTAVMLIIIVVDSSGFVSAIKAGFAENKAKKDATALIEEPFPSSDTEALMRSYKLYEYASMINTDPAYRLMVQREAALTHVDGLILWSRYQRSEAVRLFKEEGPDSSRAKALNDSLESMSKDPEDEIGDAFVIQLNALLPCTSPLVLEATDDSRAEKAERASESALALIQDWPDDLRADMFARVSLVWLCVYSGCSRKTQGKKFLRRARLWSDMSLDAFPCSLGLLCRAGVCKAAGENHQAIESLKQFVETALPDRRDYAGACYNLADLMYRDEQDANSIVDIVERGKKSEAECGDFWKNTVNLPLIVDASKRKFVFTIV